MLADGVHCCDTTTAGALALMGGRTMHERRALELQQASLRADLQKQVTEKRLAKAIALAELKMDDLNLLRDCERKNVDEYGQVIGFPGRFFIGRAFLRRFRYRCSFLRRSPRY